MVSDGIGYHVPHVTVWSAHRARVKSGTTTGSSSFKPLHTTRATAVFGSSERNLEYSWENRVEHGLN